MSSGFGVLQIHVSYIIIIIDNISSDNDNDDINNDNHINDGDTTNNDNNISLGPI